MNWAEFMGLVDFGWWLLRILIVAFVVVGLIAWAKG
jgi:hypothetical protein